MTKLAAIFAVLAVAFLGAHLWLGPICTNLDGCDCGLSRRWISFDEQPGLRNIQLFMRITSPGNPHHHHEFTDPVYDTNSALGFIGVGLGLASVVSWFWPHRSMETLVLNKKTFRK